MNSTVRIGTFRLSTITLGALLFCGVLDASAQTPSGREKPDVLHVDPLMIEQAIQVWNVIGKEENSIWPGWDASQTPILFYLPGKQDVLIGHPNPPDGFRKYNGPLQFPGKTIHIRDQATLIEFDGQNTSYDVNGTQTLVVADTLSNLRPQIESLVSNAANGNEVKVEFEVLRSNPYSTMEMIAHEAFHVYQHHQAPGKSANELDLVQYPTLSVENNLGFALEGAALSKALTQESAQAVREAAIEWLAIRNWRRKALPPACIAYEDGTEFNEGLAKYVEYRLTQSLEGTEPRPMLWMIQGFAGFQDLQPERDRLLKQMQAHMRGEVNVNNDPYGASPLRMRFYFSGMAIAALLDKLGANWKVSILKPQTTLTSIVEEVLKVEPAELEALAVDALKDRTAIDLRGAKQKLAEDGQAYVAKVLDGIERGLGTELVVDYSALPDAKISMAFTPFGILAIDADRTVFRLIPLSVRIRPETLIRQTRPVELLQDRKAKTVAFQLAERINPAAIMQQLSIKAEDATSDKLQLNHVKIEKLSLPGAELQIGWADVSLEASKLVIRLVPE